MSDLVQRLRRLYVDHGTNYVQEAADRIEVLEAEPVTIDTIIRYVEQREADEALLRQALEALISLSKDHTYVKPTERAIIAALRERLGEKE